ncbi:MAG: hypothetical protein PHT69_11930 [Bacteroidales bacterium]|nr:hypothetical protein [Bacteroidales bacterium]
MLFIVNKDISHISLSILNTYGEVLLFGTEGITYDGINNHPDIFLTQLDSDSILYAPNTPQTITNSLKKSHFFLHSGDCNVGKEFPKTAYYNAVITEKYIIHHLKYTDTALLKICSDRTFIDVKQAYTRCNLLALKNNTFITSDKGIFKALQSNQLTTFYVNPEQVFLKGFKNGFFGGCCGISRNFFFVNGSLKYLKEATLLRSFISESHLQIVELHQEAPEDLGSIIILE